VSIDLHGEARDAVVERPRVASDDRFLSETDAEKKPNASATSKGPSVRAPKVRPNPCRT